MLSLNRLKIKGFRAYTEEQEFIFDNPMILLFGENHCGKSSTLNAIEWCLFGNNECIGEKTGIRERVGWVVPNLTLEDNSEVFVELELKDENNQIYKIFRKWLSKTRDLLKVTLPDRTEIKDEEAKKKLDSLLKITFKDYMATIYQHQETIRGILTQVPKDRNDTIDRLLGLSDYRNINEAINERTKYLKDKKKEVSLSEFSKEIDRFKKNLENIIIEKKEEARDRGINEEQLDGVKVLEIANKEVKEELQKFAEDIGFEIPEINIPENWQELQSFRKFAEDLINKYRKEMPDVTKQKELINERTQFIGLQSNYEEARKNLKNTEKKLQDFIGNNGDDESINNKIAIIKERIAELEKEKKEINAKGAIIGQAIDYLKLDGVDKNVCPVCGKETPDLLEHLKEEWETKYKEHLGRIEKEIDNLKEDLDKNDSLLKEYKGIQKDFETQEKVLIAKIKEIETYLQKEIKKEDDPLSLLNIKLQDINLELKNLESSVGSKQEKLNNISSSLDKIKLIEELLNFKEREKFVEHIEEKDEYKKMKSLEKKISELNENLTKIMEAIISVSNEEAKEKIDVAGEAINSYFCQITNNPLITEIKFNVTKDQKNSFNSYDFKGSKDEDLIPLLSQGDLNALALSIFLGLSSSERMNQPFNFIILDDPSQSLSSGHKENLVKVLNGILEHRVIILSSMDKEFQKFLENNITKVKTKYKFINWTPDKGPQVERE